MVVTADDPSCHSSQNEQDNRHYARAAKIAMVEPSDPQECKDFVKPWPVSCRSEFDLPRCCTAPPHGSATPRDWSQCGERRGARLRRRPTGATSASSVCTPAHAYANHPLVEERLQQAGGVRLHPCAGKRPEQAGAGRRQGGRHHGLRRLPVRQGGVPGGDVLPEAGPDLSPCPWISSGTLPPRVEKLYVIEELEPLHGRCRSRPPASPAWARS